MVHHSPLVITALAGIVVGVGSMTIGKTSEPSINRISLRDNQPTETLCCNPRSNVLVELALKENGEIAGAIIRCKPKVYTNK